MHSQIAISSGISMFLLCSVLAAKQDEGRVLSDPRSTTTASDGSASEAEPSSNDSSEEGASSSDDSDVMAHEGEVDERVRSTPLSEGDSRHRKENESEHSAEQEAVSSGAVVANPLALLFGLFNIDAGFAIADEISGNLGANYWSFGLLGVRHTAWGVSAGAQIFFTGSRYSGAFVYPALEYAHTTVSIDDFTYSGSLFGPSAIVGYQWDWKPFTVRVAGGLRYYVGGIDSGDLHSELEGAAFKLDGSLGFTF